MSQPENFLERWSRRKLADAEPAAAKQKQIAPQTEKENRPAAPVASDDAPNAPVAKTEDKPFDPASLPSIESIDVNTDVTAFLRPGVPADLTRAALRRAWSSDPAIRDFVGLVENGWDFNDPNAMGGFGPIGADEAARLLAQATGELPELAKKMLAELPEESAPAEGQEQLEQPAVSSQPVRSMIDESGAPRESDDVRRNIDVVKNDASQEESDG
jgi:uncharacterized protein DUF3306